MAPFLVRYDIGTNFYSTESNMVILRGYMWQLLSLWLDYMMEKQKPQIQWTNLIDYLQNRSIDTSNRYNRVLIELFSLHDTRQEGSMRKNLRVFTNTVSICSGTNSGILKCWFRKCASNFVAVIINRLNNSYRVDQNSSRSIQKEGVQDSVAVVQRRIRTTLVTTSPERETIVIR